MIDLSMPFNVKREILTEGDFYTEGPAVGVDGKYYFTNLAGGQVIDLREGRQQGLWAVSSCPNGQVVLEDDTHLICDSIEAAVKHFDANGHFTRDLVKGSCAGLRVYSPNDIVTDNSDAFYFTDSVRHTGNIFCKSASGEESVIASGLDYPNGLVFSDGGEYLYVAESYANRILRFKRGKPRPEWIGEVWCDLPKHPSGQLQSNLPDGLAIDGEGKLWVAHYGMGALQVIDTEGEWLATIPTGLPLTSNLCLLTANSLLVTGGFSEPGPGALIKLTILAAL